MRILFVSETYPPEINGVAMTAGRLVAGMRARGHWVGVVRPKQHRHDQGGESEWMVPGIALPQYAEVRLGMPYWLRLYELIQAQRPDVVHIVTEGPLGWAALYAARAHRIPVSSGYHTHFDQYSAHYGMGWLTRGVTHALDALHRRCQATMVPAPELADVLSARGIPNVNVVGRGVDTELFHPGRRTAVLRQAWDAQDDAPVCLYVGRLAPEKNLGLTARAFAAIQQHIPGARMVWVGDGPARKTLMAAHPEHHFAGVQRGEALATHYASADLFLFASVSETWGNVVAEALASGLGVVTYRRAAGAALIEPGVNGVALPPGDAEAFIEAAVQLAQDTPRRLRMGQNACARMGAHGWNTVTSQFEHLLHSAAYAT